MCSRSPAESTLPLLADKMKQIRSSPGRAATLIQLALGCDWGTRRATAKSKLQGEGTLIAASMDCIEPMSPETLGPSGSIPLEFAGKPFATQVILRTCKMCGIELQQSTVQDLLSSQRGVLVRFVSADIFCIEPVVKHLASVSMARAELLTERANTGEQSAQSKARLLNLAANHMQAAMHVDAKHGGDTAARILMRLVDLEHLTVPQKLLNVEKAGAIIRELPAGARHESFVAQAKSVHAALQPSLMGSRLSLEDARVVGEALAADGLLQDLSFEKANLTFVQEADEASPGRIICAGLCANGHLRTLSFEAAQLSCDTFENAQWCGLLELNVSNGVLSKEVLPGFVSFMKGNKSIRHLFAQRNHLGPEGATSFGNMLEHNSTLTLLNVSGNQMEAEGAAALADGLKANSTVQQLHAQNNGLGPEGAKSFGNMLEHNSTLTLLDVSGNQMEAEGAAALADGLKANSTVQQLDASKNAMGTAGAKAFGDMLLENKTIQTLDVSDNSFGQIQRGDKVKLKSSGETATVKNINDDGSVDVKKADGSTLDYVGRAGKEQFEWESQVPAFCAGVAASPSLISVSTTFKHALDVSISHSFPHSYHVRSSMFPPTAWAWMVERPSLHLSLIIAPLHR